MDLTLQLSERARRDLSLLASLDETQSAKLVDALKQADVSVYPDRLREYIQNNLAVDEDSASSLTRALLELHVTRMAYNMNSSEFADDIINSLQADSEKIKLGNKNWDQFKEELILLLGFDETIGITAKALDVITEDERIFRNNDSRILSDIRPVFFDDATKKPPLAVIIHTLKLACIENGDLKDIYIVLDSRDLQELKGILDRAEQKESTLRSIIESAGIQYFDLKEKR